MKKCNAVSQFSSNLAEDFKMPIDDVEAYVKEKPFGFKPQAQVGQKPVESNLGNTQDVHAEPINDNDDGTSLIDG